MWTKLQYESAATKIGKQFVESDGAESINDMSTKVARDAGLNPDGIRSMVRLANVATFETIFEKKGAEKAEDRMIEFDLGDPEVVIHNLYKGAKESVAVEKTAEAYNKQLDYFGDLPAEEIEPLEKSASAVPGVELSVQPEQLYSPVEVKFAFERAADRMREDSKQAEYRWLDRIEKAARSMVSYNSDTGYRTAFEKNAVSLLGEKVVPELTGLRSLTGPMGVTPILFDGEKVASVVKHHIANVSTDEKPIMDMVKEAHEARIFVERCQAGLQWIADNMPGCN